MKTLDFSIQINAPKEKVWSIMWNDTYYRKWAAVFCEGTYAVSDWKEGDFIQFLTPKGEGMHSIIEKKTANEYMAFKHLSMVKNFEILAVDEAMKAWVGAMETYRLTEAKGLTILEVKVDTTEEYAGFLNNAFLKAIATIKELSEE